MPTVTKRDLAGLLADEAGLKKSLAYRCADALFQAMAESITQGNRIEIRGFGVFQVKDTRPKPAARNPRTGEIIYVPARRKTHFKPGRLLKEALHQTRGGEVDAPSELPTGTQLPTGTAASSDTASPSTPSASEE